MLRHLGLDTSVRGVTESLSAFWFQTWTRDTPTQESDISWSKFSAFLRQAQSPIGQVDLQMEDPQAWIHVIRSLQVTRATGVSGWSNADLKVLREGAIADLCMAITSNPADCFDANSMQARIVS